MSANVDKQLHQVEGRLVERFGPERADDVRSALSAERGRFEGARVTAFVPILVERHARRRLERQG
ncbi:three-helix bundle dimerization domain-containing protein [Actinokineospora sp. G85]|uniref:three-helix bundle dimerization domain-containing protein n=1 Tax=Actinokineospora sp. G85 TaxID=3406626 RepID=UPI003C70CC6F